MADSNPWSEIPTYSVYVPPDEKTLNFRMNFLIDKVRGKSQEINNLMYEIDKCKEALQKIYRGP